MRYPEVKKELKIAFENFLKPEGFKSKTSSTGCNFLKIKGDLKIEIGFSVSNYFDTFHTGFYFDLVNERINYLYGKIVFGDQIKAMIALNAGDYFKKMNYTCERKTQKDIENWMPLVKKFYFEFALNLISEFESIEFHEAYLNSNTAIQPQYTAFGGRIKVGLILSKLLKPQNYEHLKNKYIEIIELKRIEREEMLKNAVKTTEVHDPFESIYKTIEYLDNHSNEDLHQMLKEQE
jgi:hypothetical protein